MFSLIYLKGDNYGVIDDKTLHFHMLSKESFDLMVSSAKEEEVEIRGVEFTEDGYICYPVAFEGKPNMFNCLPYVKKHFEVSRKARPDAIYMSCFSTLISIAYGGARITKDYLLIKLSVFAYYHIRVSPSSRIGHSMIEEMLQGLCKQYQGIEEVLYKEPYPDDVMKKFKFKPMNVQESSL